VYILKSLNVSPEYYVGVTSDPKARVQAHNAGLSPHTARQRPWRPLVVIEFDEEEPALAFERYLKTGSGREFARRHFIARRLDLGSREPGRSGLCDVGFGLRGWQPRFSVFVAAHPEVLIERQISA
jgi:putative endonuclease